MIIDLFLYCTYNIFVIIYILDIRELSYYIFQQFFIIFMSHQNWLDVSDSDTSTEREDDEEVSEEQVKVQTKLEPVKQVSQPLNFREKNQTHQRNKTNKNFPKPEQIIQQLNKQDRKVNNLTINYCFHYKQEQLKEMFPMITKVNNYKQGSFQVFFASKQDTIKFVEQKIANNIKFYVKIPFTRPQRYNNKEYQYKKSQKFVPRTERRQQVKPRIIQEKKQVKQVQKIIIEQKKQIKAPARLFSENKITLNQSSSSSQIISEIQTFKLFSQFNRLILSCPPQIKQHSNKIVEQICNQVNCHYQINSRQDTTIFYLIEGKKIIEAPKIIQSPKIQQKIQSKTQKIEQKQGQREYKKKVYAQKKPKRRQYKETESKTYLRHNIVYVESNMDNNQVINQIRNANIFESYGALRFKTSEENVNLTKELIKRVQNEFKCKIIKQQISEQGVVFILQQLVSLQQQQKVKKKYVEKQKLSQAKMTLNQNKLIINCKFNINQVIDQIKAKRQVLKRDFNSLKIIAQTQQFRNDAKNLASKISQQFKWKKINEIKKQSQQQPTKFIFDINLQECLVQQKQQLIDISLNNYMKINENVNVAALIAEFKIKRKKIFEQFNRFRFKAEEISNTKIDQIKLKFREQPLLNIQIEKKNDIIEIIISQKAEDTNDQRQRRKVDTTKIHDFLQRGDKRV